MAEPFKLVLSGGSSNQKAEVMRKIRAAAAAKGYTVLLVPSAEKLLEQGGLTPKVYARKRDNQSNAEHWTLELICRSRNICSCSKQWGSTAWNYGTNMMRFFFWIPQTARTQPHGRAIPICECWVAIPG